MADVNSGDILRIGAVWTFEGTYEVANVFHAQNVAGGDRTYAAAALDVQEYIDDLYDNILASMSDEMSSDLITMANVTQGTTHGAIAWPAPLTGGNINERTAPGVCLFAWGRTAIPRVQIRKYFGIFTDAGMDDGVWNAAARAACDALMVEHVQNYIGGNGMTLRGVAFNRVTLLGTFADSVSTSAEPSYQRRRKRGRGS